MLDIIIDGEKYSYMGKVKLNEKEYVLYTDNENIHVSSYEIINNDVKFENVDDVIYNQVIKEFNNESI